MCSNQLIYQRADITRWLRPPGNGPEGISGLSHHSDAGPRYRCRSSCLRGRWGEASEGPAPNGDGTQDDE